jgi:hypothetical protein
MALNGAAVNAFGSVSAVSTSGGHERAGHSPPPPKTFRRRNPRGPGHWRFTAARKRARNDRVGEGGSGRPGQLRPVHVRPAGTRRQHGALGHHSARGDDPARGGAEGVVPCGSRRPMPVPEPAGHRRAPAAAQPSDDRRAAGRHPAAVHVDFGSQGGPWSRRARSCGCQGKEVAQGAPELRRQAVALQPGATSRPRPHTERPRSWVHGRGLEHDRRHWSRRCSRPWSADREIAGQRLRKWCPRGDLNPHAR